MTDFSFTLEPDEPDTPEPETPVTPHTYGDAEYLRLLLQLMPPGAAWTRAVGSSIYKLLSGLAPEFARAQARAVDLLAEFNPATAVEMLDEYEEINGLPDACGTPPTTTEDRQAALAARLLDTAGHNPADYQALAEALGHPGTSIHRRPYPPFRAAIGRAGGRLYGNEWAHVFGVAYMTDELASGSWSLSTTTETSTTKVAPDGDADARELTFGASGYAYKDISPAPTSAQASVWLRVASGAAAVTLGLYQGVTLIESQTFNVDTSWRRYVLRAEHASTLTTFRLSCSSDVVEVWGEMVGEVDTTLECRFEAVSQSHTVPEFWVIGEYVEPLE